MSEDINIDVLNIDIFTGDKILQVNIPDYPKIKIRLRKIVVLTIIEKLTTALILLEESEEN